jgi:hypothetical protein
MDPPSEGRSRKRKRWLRQWKRLLGPVLWLLARLIDKAIEHTRHC